MSPGGSKCAFDITGSIEGWDDHRNLEIIVVNDGSTDDTATMVEQVALADSRIRLMSTPNRGVAAARNTGIREAAGRFVA
ncbi:glycosyltransferase family 2 protein, partial [Rhizobium leguminosarum]|uniref:glycosyltransferase family 2 protein n=1 Tax=Rhizobium leguminosarum TaxID=384 RepID=UPI003F97DBB9